MASFLVSSFFFPPSCVTLGKLLHFSVPRVSHLYNGNNNISYLIEFRESSSLK